MLKGIIKRIFGSANEREIKKLEETVKKINELEKVYLTLSDDGLKEQKNILKARLDAGENLDNILPNAFAVVREASKRTLGLRPFDVQMIGGIVLHRGQIAEMKTGEGKTLVAVMPAYLNALSGKGVHIVTVNDYLAKTHSEAMGKVFNFLGLTVGCVLNGMSDRQRKEAYTCDITYGTNSEFGFDYLRDNLKVDKEQLVQRDFNFAIVDEVDSILIDEARTPLIISGASDDDSKLYIDINNIVKDIPDSMCKIDEKDRVVSLTEEGMENVEDTLHKLHFVDENDSMYNLKYVKIVHHLNQSLKAHKLFKNEVDYTVKNGQVYIVDEFTGRIMEGRRYSDGLHQALEAKECVEVQNENQTLASITYQNYFRMYPKLSGMTGTAMTEAIEFENIYNLKCIEVPTNKKVIRKDEDDVIYKTKEGKFRAIVKQIKECHEKLQPVLVGTVSIEVSEYLSNLLKKENLSHNVLNAKYHDKEAYIIAQAGKSGAITIATNMAGRGTDIKLGGTNEFEIEEILNDKTLSEEEKKAKIKESNDKIEKDKEVVLNAGGLFVLGTERHESRRIDNQLRGRSGRQGDPGVSRFYISLEDNLMRIFGTDKLGSFLGRMGMSDDEAIVHPWISKSLEKAQKKVENMHYEMRKNILKYDDVVNSQRKVIFEQRRDIMFASSIEPEIEFLISEKNNEILNRFTPKSLNVDKWNLDGFKNEVLRVYGLDFDIKEHLKSDVNIHFDELSKKLDQITKKILNDKKSVYGEEVFRELEKRVYLLTIDRLWKDHLNSLDQIKQAMNLRAYGQKEPLVEYKKEAYYLFEELMRKITEDTIAIFSRIELNVGEVDSKEKLSDNEHVDYQQNRTDLVDTISHIESQKRTALKKNVSTEKQETVHTRKRVEGADYNTRSSWGRVGRNDPCPCGSGKKYKHCCGKEA